MPKSSSALILFAKAPKLGKVKTRLQTTFNQATVFQLYSRFLDDSLEKLGTVENVDGFVGVADEDGMDEIGKRMDDDSIKLFAQRGKGLGERMENAFTDRFREGYRSVIIIGSDSPSLPASSIHRALSSKKDLVIGPSIDGGYYLIGMNGCLTDVFGGVVWGTGSVLARTLVNIRKAGVTLDLLPVWYDVDRPEDLMFLKTHLDLLALSGEEPASATRRMLLELDIEGSADLT